MSLQTINLYKPADPTLHKVEDELKRIVDLMPHHIVVLDAGGTAIFVNQQVLEYTGLSIDEVCAGNFRERAFHPEDVERLREERNKALAGGVPFQNEQPVLRRDGNYRWFQIRYNPLLDESGKAARWYCTATDIEDRFGFWAAAFQCSVTSTMAPKKIRQARPNPPQWDDQRYGDA